MGSLNFLCSSFGRVGRPNCCVMFLSRVGFGLDARNPHQNYCGSLHLAPQPIGDILSPVISNHRRRQSQADGNLSFHHHHHHHRHHRRPQTRRFVPPLHVADKLNTTAFALSDSFYALARGLKDTCTVLFFHTPHHKHRLCPRIHCDTSPHDFKHDPLRLPLIPRSLPAMGRSQL